MGANRKKVTQGWMLMRMTVKLDMNKTKNNQTKKCVFLSKYGNIIFFSLVFNFGQ